MNKASPPNSIMNLRHTFHVIADAKALRSILYISGNIQIKRCWGISEPPSVKLSWQKPQCPEG